MSIVRHEVAVQPCHHRPLAAAAALVTAAAFLGACISSSYVPRPSPLLKPIFIDGVMKYRVSGYDYGAGLFGDLPSAVSAVPEARRYAEESAADGVAGFVLLLGGAIATGAGTVLVVTEDSPEPASLGYMGLGLMLAGVAATIGGSFMVAQSQAEQLDAINVFNDAMWARYLEARGATGTPLPRVGPARE